MIENLWAYGSISTRARLIFGDSGGLLPLDNLQ